MTCSVQRAWRPFKSKEDQKISKETVSSLKYVISYLIVHIHFIQPIYATYYLGGVKIQYQMPNERKVMVH